jgi:hypothetical protein
LSLRGLGSGKLIEICEQLGEVDFHRSAKSPEDSVLRFREAGTSADVSATRDGIECPNIWNAEVKIVINAILEAAEGIVLRKNFDANDRRMSDDLFDWPIPRNYADVGDPEAGSCDLDSLLWKRVYVPLAPTSMKPNGQRSLK